MARERLVETQLKPRGIDGLLVLGAFLEVPRHEFVPKELWAEAYADYPLPMGDGQTISQPYIVALMTQAAQLKKEDKVLEIGTGSGYQAAILSKICQEVYSIERIESLAQKARETLERLGYKNIKVKVGDGSKGWQEFAPFDAIIVTAASPSVPKTLVEQLKEGGRLVIPLGNLYLQELFRFTKKGNRLEEENLGGVRFVPLIGEEGWQESEGVTRID